MNTEQKIGCIKEKKREKQNRLLLDFPSQEVVAVKAFLEDSFLCFLFYCNGKTLLEHIVQNRYSFRSSRSETFVANLPVQQRDM
jgi:hypothetical protein